MGMSVTTGTNWNTWNMVTLGSSLVTLGGMIGGSIPGSKANQLQRSPSASMTAAEAQEWIDAFNDSLAAELGLSAKEAWLLESSER
jgi:hypothetical protein